MRFCPERLAALALIAAMSGAHAQTASARKSVAHNQPPARRASREPSVASQIQALRRDLEGQIQELRQELADRDRQLQQAEQAAADAQAAANEAKEENAQQAAASNASRQSLADLKGTVTDLQTTNASLATMIPAEQAKIQKEVTDPDAIHYKGITLSPAGSFLAAETVYRQRATGGGLNTAFTGIPLNDAPQGHSSEFYGSGRQSRIALDAIGKVSDHFTLQGYYEADWLSSGITSNNNQSNSYTLRQRQLWAQAHWGSMTFTGGQMWSLATETTKLTQNKSEILPSVIDPQYTAGFVWARQYGFRVSKDFGSKLSLAASVENAQIPSVAGHNLPDNFLVGQPGTGGGLFNSTASYASNVAPDFVAKLALEPGWGHYEIFGIGRSFRERVYPNDTSSTPSSAGAYNNITTGGGIGGSLRVPTLHKHLDVGVKGLWGDGIGRYGSSEMADTTVNPAGQLALIHGFSALSTLEFHVTQRLDLYANYGGDYAGRRYFISAPGKAVGYGSPFNVETGCDTEPAPGSGNTGYTPSSQPNCTADTKDVQEFTAGYWFNFYSGSKGRLRQGLQYAYFQRNIWSGIGATPQSTNNMFWTSFRYYLP